MFAKNTSTSQLRHVVFESRRYEAGQLEASTVIIHPNIHWIKMLTQLSEHDCEQESSKWRAVSFTLFHSIDFPSSVPDVQNRAE